jgi:hypothetical protein
MSSSSVFRGLAFSWHAAGGGVACVRAHHPRTAAHSRGCTTPQMPCLSRGPSTKIILPSVVVYKKFSVKGTLFVGGGVVRVKRSFGVPRFCRRSASLGYGLNLDATPQKGHDDNIQLLKRTNGYARMKLTSNCFSEREMYRQRHSKWYSA